MAIFVWRSNWGCVFVKTGYWIAGLALILAVCVAFSVWILMPGEAAEMVEIWSDGEFLYSLPLSVDTQLRIDSEQGSNTITVKDGKIAVTQADCPDHYCMDRGYCNGGAQIVCLPNRLVIKFVAPQEIDGVVG